MEELQDATVTLRGMFNHDSEGVVHPSSKIREHIVCELSSVLRIGPIGPPAGVKLGDPLGEGRGWNRAQGAPGWVQAELSAAAMVSMLVHWAQQRWW